jgi:hypothetical protein
MQASSVPVSNAMVLARWVRRAESLSPAAWLAAVDRWGATPADVRGAAEAAVARAAEATGRTAMRDVVIALVHELADSVGWFASRARAGSTPGETSPATVAANAALGILLRDQLAAEQFDVLYGPFAEVLPLDSLGAG